MRTARGEEKWRVEGILIALQDAECAAQEGSEESEEAQGALPGLGQVWGRLRLQG
jgi:hypothetical protein